MVRRAAVKKTIATPAWIRLPGPLPPAHGFWCQVEISFLSTFSLSSECNSVELARPLEAPAASDEFAYTFQGKGSLTPLLEVPRVL